MACGNYPTVIDITSYVWNFTRPRKWVPRKFTKWARSMLTGFRMKWDSKHPSSLPITIERRRVLGFWKRNRSPLGKTFERVLLASKTFPDKSMKMLKRVEPRSSLIIVRSSTRSIVRWTNTSHQLVDRPRSVSSNVYLNSKKPLRPPRIIFQRHSMVKHREHSSPIFAASRK